MNFKLNGKLLTVIVILFLIIITIIFLANQSTGTPKVPFAGLREKSVIYDGWTECPNGDGV